MATSRVPIKDEEFNSYINSTTNYLQVTNDGESDPNWERLGLTSDENDQWQAYRTGWNDTYEITTEQANKGVRDKTAISNKNKAKDDFTDWVTDPEFNKLNRIGSSPNIKQGDRDVFHIKLRDDTRTIPTTPIEEVVVLDLEPVGGGDMKAKARTSNDGSRASIPDTAKAVELCYTTGTTAPNSVADCEHTHISTKAMFTFNVGAENHNQNLYCYARWIDTNNPARAGSWTDLITTGIL